MTVTKKFEAAPVWFGYAGNPQLLKPPMKCVIVDLDGTLLNNEHRQHFMRGEKKNWAGFFAAMTKDTAYPEIKLLVELIFKHTSLAVVLTTSRPSQYHGETLENLHSLDISFSSLVMRAQTDNRPDAMVKLDMLYGIRNMGFEPVLCFDDRPEVVEMWRNEGIRTLACDPGPWREHVISTSLMDKLALVDEVQRLQASLAELQEKYNRAFGA